MRIHEASVRIFEGYRVKTKSLTTIPDSKRNKYLEHSVYFTSGEPFLKHFSRMYEPGVSNNVS